MRHAVWYQWKGLARLCQLVSLVFQIDQAKANQFVERFWSPEQGQTGYVVLWLEPRKWPGTSATYPASNNRPISSYGLMPFQSVTFLLILWDAQAAVLIGWHFHNFW